MVLRLYYSYVRCHYWRKLGERYKFPFVTSLQEPEQRAQKAEPLLNYRHHHPQVRTQERIRLWVTKVRTLKSPG